MSRIDQTMVDRATEAYSDIYDGVSHNTDAAMRAAITAAIFGDVDGFSVDDLRSLEWEIRNYVPEKIRGFASLRLLKMFATSPESAPTKDQLISAYERAGAAESALRRLVDECENDGVAGWEERMASCIAEANQLLTTG